jgi:hypothetical protein
MAGGRSPRRKGDGIEPELVELLRALGVHAERYPLSAARRFRDSGHDVDLYVRGRDEAPLVAEVKARWLHSIGEMAGTITMGCSCAAISSMRSYCCHGACGRT